jgi:hypothetical protein
MGRKKRGEKEGFYYRRRFDGENHLHKSPSFPLSCITMSAHTVVGKLFVRRAINERKCQRVFGNVTDDFIRNLTFVLVILRHGICLQRRGHRTYHLLHIRHSLHLRQVRLYRVCEKSVCSSSKRVLHCVGSGKLLYIKRVRWHKWPMSHSHGRYFQHFTASRSTVTLSLFYIIPYVKRLRWSRGSVLAFGTQVRGFTPGRNRRIFRAKNSSARLPSEGK